ncbi:single-stranded DNA-binding protein [Leifsonia poae]|uniref:single-stranded DNA-binding protein n=1 Tax=Leifsonia poae TaxID=110933 RepID=UPI001CC1124B|nr:single-stranded DNA-binding protein [Leifsonia poae]
MNDSLSTRGFVATAPNHIVTAEGLPITTFRLASTRRKYNRETQTWENGETNWFTVTAFRQLAINVAGCIVKGDPVMVSGRLSVREWQNDDRSGIVVEIDADAVGHDLGWGTAAFSRTIKRVSADGVADSPRDQPEDAGGERGERTDAASGADQPEKWSAPPVSDDSPGLAA